MLILFSVSRRRLSPPRLAACIWQSHHPRGTLSCPSVLSMPAPDITPASKSTHVSIRPGVGILSVLRHLNYKAWFAMAEFVDNSLQSYLHSREQLEKLHGKDFRLKVEVEIE